MEKKPAMGWFACEAIPREPGEQAHALLSPPLALDRIGMKDSDIEEPRRHNGGGGRITGGLQRRVGEIPGRTGTVAKLLEPRRRQRDCAIQIVSPTRRRRCRGKTVNRPPGAPRPRGFIRVPLKCVRPCTAPGAVVVFHGMIESSVRTDEITLRHDGVSLAG